MRSYIRMNLCLLPLNLGLAVASILYHYGR
jgi:hypothetical protein